MSGQYNVRWFEQSDLDAYIRGLNETLYEEYDAARFRWKMVDTPFSFGFASIATVEHDGVPVAFNSFLPLQLRRGGEVFQIVQGCDGFVEPEHRRMGLFQETLKFMFKELGGKGPEMLIGFNFAGSALAAQKVGSAITGDVHALCGKPQDLAAVNLAGVDDVEVTPCGLDELFRIYEDWASTSQVLHIQRTPEFLKWRYSHPIRRSSFYHIRDGDNEGYAAVSLERDGDSNTLFIEDYSPILDEPRVALALIKHVLAKGDPVKEVYFTEIVGSKMYASAQSLGFTPDHIYHVIMRNIGGLEEREKRLYRGGKEVTNLADWRIVSSDVF